MALQITGRAAWGAKPPTRTLVSVTWPAGGVLWAHHTVGNYVKADPGDVGAKWLAMLKAPAKYPADKIRAIRMKVALNAAAKKQTVAAEIGAMKEIQRFHQHTRGWSDIGYAYVVFASGRIYEARGQHVGAHCPGHNSEPSCSFAGDYSKMSPTPRAISAFDELRVKLRARGWRGHREGFPTACPGNALYGALMREVQR